MRLGLLIKIAASAAVCLLNVSPGAGEERYEFIALDGAHLKWGAPRAGTPAVVTYAVASAPRHFLKARNCSGVTTPDAMLRTNGIERSAFDGELVAAFSAWSSVADIAFREADPASADILIGAQLSPRGRAFTNVEHANVTPSPDRIRTLERAVICLNPEQRWKIAFDGNLEIYDLRYALIHEIGHAIGLDHPESEGELMGFRYRELFRQPQAGDIKGASGLYGTSPSAVADIDAGSSRTEPSSLALTD